MAFSAAERAEIREGFRKLAVERHRYHVIPYRTRWFVVENSNPKNRQMTRTREAAVQKARELAMESKGEVIVHRKDGHIQERFSFRDSVK
jgi:DNA primase